MPELFLCYQSIAKCLKNSCTQECTAFLKKTNQFVISENHSTFHALMNPLISFDTDGFRGEINGFILLSIE